MKTPREILLDRHQAATAQLDTVRRFVVAGLNGPAAEPVGQRRNMIELLGELFRIPKPALAGFGLAWLVIIVLNLASRDTLVPAAPPAQMAQRPAATLQDLREQKRLFAELVGSLKDTEVATPRFVPRPRGESSTSYHYA
jgi:hypothetical protein